MSKEIVNDKDIIRVIENAVLLSELYGYGTSLSKEEKMVNDKLMENLEKKVSRKEYIELEKQINELIGVSETTGFKRGFHIAMRIVVDGLRIEDR